MKKIILTTFILTIFLVTFLVVHDPVQAETGVVIDFEGLEAGDLVESLSYGQGINGIEIEGSVTVFGHNQFFPGENAAMIFDAACPGGCTGFDFDLFAPEQGMVLIVSQDLDPSDPNDAQFTSSLEFDFQDLGSGKVTVDSLTIGDVDAYEEGGVLEFYAGGSEGTLLATLPIPVTGDNVYTSLTAGVSGVDYMRIAMNGSAAIDDISLEPEKEILYLSDTLEKKDGLSNLYRVEIDEDNNQANLILLPNGTVNYDHVDAIAATPDGSRLYFVQEWHHQGEPILAYYDLENDTVHEVGNIYIEGDPEDPVLWTDQAAFSPDGTLYIAGSKEKKLYTVNTENAEAVEVGTVVNEATGDDNVVLDVNGADIAFSAEGDLYLWINRGKKDAPVGLYLLALPAQDGMVMAAHLGSSSHGHGMRGLALRGNGAGDLVGMSVKDDLHSMDRANASDTAEPMPFYLDGVEIQLNDGDMSIGPFAQMSAAKP